MLVLYSEGTGMGAHLTNCGTQKRLWHGLNDMRPWEHGLEQILAKTGMQNRKTKRKILARQMSTKVRRGGMCSPSRKAEKGDIL